MSEEHHPSPSGTAIASLPGIYCRGEIDALSRWLRGEEKNSLTRAIAIIIFGCAAYGYTIGLWRSPLMAAYVAIKLPLLIFLTVAANGLLNGLFAQILGSGLSFRQTAHTILMSFTTFALIVGALSPITLFLAINTPRPEDGEIYRWHGFTLLIHTTVIAYAGIIANMKMHRLMAVFSGNPGAARRTFLAWIAGNLFVGAQLAYVFRPFFGSPGLDVAFLRPDPLHGNFYEAVYNAANNFTGGQANIILPALLFMGLIFAFQIRSADRRYQNQEK